MRKKPDNQHFPGGIQNGVARQTAGICLAISNRTTRGLAIGSSAVLARLASGTAEALDLLEK
jgi:hypothetical protein